MDEDEAEEAEAEEVLWPDGSPVTVGQSVRIVIAEPRYTGKIGEVASVNYCHRRRTTPRCRSASTHSFITKSAWPASSSAWGGSAAEVQRWRGDHTWSVRL